MHLPDQIVGLEHAAHAVGQREGHGHRQSFGYSHYDECNGHHQGFQGVGQQ